MTRLRIPYLEAIWRIEGSLALDEPISPHEAFARLDPPFRTDGTRYAIDGDTLAYIKTNPRAQDPLATFTSGTLRLERSGSAARLTWQAASTALLLCFLAPLLFLLFAQVMEAANDYERAKAEVSAARKGAQKEAAKDKPVPKLHPIDAMLGAPAPKDPNADKNKKKEPKPKFKTTQAYVLSGLFFVIYLVGRVLEPWLLKRTFRRALSQGRSAGARTAPSGEEPAPARASPA